METEALAASRGFDGEHLPGVLGDDVGEVGDDEINLVLGVGVDASPASVRTYLIDTTVGGASGNSEAQTCCLAHERQLGQFSQGFAGGAWGGL
jgi:hypothetical protein